MGFKIIFTLLFSGTLAAAEGPKCKRWMDILLSETKRLSKKGYAVAFSRFGELEESPLQISIRAEDMKSFNSLLEGGVDLNVKNRMGETPLLLAIKYKRKSMVSSLLERGADPNIPDRKGRSLLFAAMLRKSDEIAGELVKYKALVDEVFPSGKEGRGTPLHWAMFSGNFKLASVFLREGANIEIKNSLGKAVLTELLEKEKFYEADFLIKKGAKLDVKDENGQTYLHRALAFPTRNVKVAKYLVDRGANGNIVDNMGNTPLHLLFLDSSVRDFIRISREEERDLVPLLIKNMSDIDVQNAKGETLLHALASNPNRGIRHMADLLDAGANPNIFNNQRKMPLHLLGDRKSEFNGYLVSLLLAKGANPNIGDADNIMPIHKFAEIGDVGSVLFLLKYGAIIREEIFGGKAPQVWMVDFMRLPGGDIVKRDLWNSILMNAGVDMGIRETNQFLPQGRYAKLSREDLPGNPLRRALFSGDFEFAGILIDAGAKIDDAINGKTALGEALDMKDFLAADFLLKKGANLEMKNDKGETYLLSALSPDSQNREAAIFLLQKGANTQATNRDGDTPLHLIFKQEGFDGENQSGVAREKDDYMVTLLLEKMSDINIKNKAGNTPLHIFLANKHRQNKLLPRLLNAGADPNSVNNTLQSPLHVLANANDRWSGYLTYLLLAEGADPNFKNSLDITPLHVFARIGDAEAVLFLLEFGARANEKTLSRSTPLHFLVKGHSERLGKMQQVKGKGLRNWLSSRREAKSHMVSREQVGAVLDDDVFLSRASNALGGRSQASPGRLKRRAGEEVASEEDRFELLLFALTDAGGDINARDYMGNTVLHLLAKEGADPHSVEILFRAGADPKIENVGELDPFRFF